jgi:nucleoside-diphosphate-sugar epimerase
MPLAGQARARFSFVHLDDVVRATVSAIESDYCGVLNIVDDRPAVYSEWLPAYARSIGAPAPRRLPMFLVRWITGAYGVHLMDGQRGASNARARRLLGWELTHPSYL